MARKATRSKARSTSRTKSAASRPAPTGSPRERIIQAFMTLLAEHPIERAITPSILLATVYHVMGIDPSLSFEDRTGRPIAILDDQEPLSEIL